ncbi:MAG: ABC transporter ATP-binding protein, partial [Clostridia bacterium]|nr:ABC transporter ATP-binding protein [Clostridia bacterium]
MRTRPKARPGTLKRALRLLFGFYPVMVPVAVVCIVFSAIVAVLPAVFIEQITTLIDTALKEHTAWEAVRGPILTRVLILGCIYVVSILAVTFETQIAAVITQGYLAKLRKRMFDGMQDLPVSYFDTHKHGDIMSHYTNDIDTLRQLIGQSLPTLVRAGTVVFGVLFLMLWYSLPLTAVVLCGVLFMFFFSKKLGGGSARYFIRLQRSVGEAEGYIQEMVNGQRVVKVFCHEDRSRADFDRYNAEIEHNSYRANAYANMLGPIINNLGNILYVLVAITGCMLLVNDVPNVSVQRLFVDVPFVTVGVIVSFLAMTRQFAGNVNQVSQQINSVVMALAGADRIFTLMDEMPEKDDGYVTLVNARIAPDGTITETDEHTGHWAWRHPHAADGTVTYTPLRGDVRLTDVDFAYEEGKPVLHGVTVYAEPGQRVAFVGATGAGKTTITNLINRFYDIDDGKIRYDGININKIKKFDLRRSLGIVLQDTNLFTGTVMDNIRYGKLDATDEECIKAAKLANAHDFITRLPQGYETMLT